MSDYIEIKAIYIFYIVIWMDMRPMWLEMSSYRVEDVNCIEIVTRYVNHLWFIL